MGSSHSGYRAKDEYGWRYDVDETSDDILRAATALENIHLERKSRNLASWRYYWTVLLFCYSFCCF